MIRSSRWIILFLLSCTILSAQSSAENLEKYFLENGYRYVMRVGQDSIWDKNGNPALIEKMLVERKADDEALFIAANLFFRYGNWQPSAEATKWLAKLYAKALKKNYTGWANPWGIADDNGEMGEYLTMMGEETVHAFYPLLRCRKKLFYGGSRTATMGRIYRYRVRDVAASQIAAIRKIEIELSDSPRERNKQIRALRKKLR